MMLGDAYKKVRRSRENARGTGYSKAIRTKKNLLVATNEASLAEGQGHRTTKKSLKAGLLLQSCSGTSVKKSNKRAKQRIAGDTAQQNIHDSPTKKGQRDRKSKVRRVAESKSAAAKRRAEGVDEAGDESDAAAGGGQEAESEQEAQGNSEEIGDTDPKEEQKAGAKSTKAGLEGESDAAKGEEGKGSTKKMPKAKSEPAKEKSTAGKSEEAKSAAGGNGKRGRGTGSGEIAEGKKKKKKIVMESEEDEVEGHGETEEGGKEELQTLCHMCFGRGDENQMGECSMCGVGCHIVTETTIASVRFDCSKTVGGSVVCKECIGKDKHIPKQKTQKGHSKKARAAARGDVQPVRVFQRIHVVHFRTAMCRRLICAVMCVVAGIMDGTC